MGILSLSLLSHPLGVFSHGLNSFTTAPSVPISKPTAGCMLANSELELGYTHTCCCKFQVYAIPLHASHTHCLVIYASKLAIWDRTFTYVFCSNCAFGMGINSKLMYIKDHQVNKIIFCCTVNDIPTSLHHANQTAALSMHTGSSTTHSIQPNSITS